MDKNGIALKSLLTLTDRTDFELNGVEGVKGFDDDYAVLSLSDTELIIYGEGLKIIDLSKESGKIKISGRIDTITYGGVSKRRRR